MEIPQQFPYDFASNCDSPSEKKVAPNSMIPGNRVGWKRKSTSPPDMDRKTLEIRGMNFTNITTP